MVGNGHPLPYARVVVHAAISWRRRKWHGEVPHGALPEQTGATRRPPSTTATACGAPWPTCPADRRRVVLRHYLDLDEAATAAALGCSIGTVKSQTAKGLARLRVSMDSERAQ